MPLPSPKKIMSNSPRSADSRDVLEQADIGIMATNP
jgi:hypothetical protein